MMPKISFLFSFLIAVVIFSVTEGSLRGTALNDITDDPRNLAAKTKTKAKANKLMLDANSKAKDDAKKDGAKKDDAKAKTKTKAKAKAKPKAKPKAKAKAKAKAGEE